MSEKKITAVEIWSKYQNGLNYQQSQDIPESVRRAYAMYEGDQWRDISASGEKKSALPVINFIKPAVDHKTAMIAMQDLSINYSPENLGSGDDNKVCEALNREAAKVWERTKQTSRAWEVVEKACIAGGAYQYFYNKELDSEIISPENIFFSNEQEPNIQKQEYVIIYERRPVSAVRRDAEQNGIKGHELGLIVADSDTTETEVADAGKISCLLYFSRDEDGHVQFCRCTEHVIYQPMRSVTSKTSGGDTISGMKLYPIVGFRWMSKYGSARGLGMVNQLRPNQVYVNKLAYWELTAARYTAYPRPVYNVQAIENIEEAEDVGRPIRVKGNVLRAAEAFGYQSPAQMSAQPAMLRATLMQDTRELAGAGDAALGNINPERASGAAIIALQDQQAIPLNRQISAYKQYVEDIALVWLDMWKTYRGKGLTVSTMETALDPLTGMPVSVTRTEDIPAADLRRVSATVKIDATPTNPFSKWAQEQSLEIARNNQQISFDEYVEGLRHIVNPTAPLAAFEAILRRRQESPMFPAQGGEMPEMGGMGTNMSVNDGMAQPVTTASAPMMPAMSA